MVSSSPAHSSAWHSHLVLPADTHLAHLVSAVSSPHSLVSSFTGFFAKFCLFQLLLNFAICFLLVFTVTVMPVNCVVYVYYTTFRHPARHHYLLVLSLGFRGERFSSLAFSSCSTFTNLPLFLILPFLSLFQPFFFRKASGIPSPSKSTAIPTSGSPSSGSPSVFVVRPTASVNALAPFKGAVATAMVASATAWATVLVAPATVLVASTPA